MNVHVSYKAGKTPEVEREFQHQIHKLGRRLQVFKPDLIHLHAFIAQDNHYSASSSLNLRLPSGQMAAQRSGENALAAVKASFADLLAQVTKHKELLRGQWTRNERCAAQSPGAGRSTAPSAASAAAARPAAKAAQAVVAETGPENWINANLPAVREFVARELQLRVAAGRIREGQISGEEVIDEIMVSALSRDGRSSPVFTQESWFHRLAMRAMARLMHANADTGNVSLDAPAGLQNVTGSDENTLQYYQPDDRLNGENVICDAKARTPEEIVSSEEMVAQLDIVLHEVNAPAREAFVLYTLEGFTVDEISRLTSRPHEEVRKSIQHAREKVQQKLPEQNEFRRSLLRRSRVA